MHLPGASGSDDETVCFAFGASVGVALAKNSLSSQQQAPTDPSEPPAGLRGGVADQSHIFSKMSQLAFARQNCSQTAMQQKLDA